MESRDHRYDIIAVVVALFIVAAPCAAQELDSAQQAFLLIRDALELTGFDAIDTASTGNVISLLNAGLRAIEGDIPWTVADTIAIVANTFLYTLSATFLRPPDDDEQLSGYSCMVISASGKLAWGLQEVPLKDLHRLNMVSTTLGNFSIKGDQLHIAPASPPGASIYVYGPGTVTPVSHGGSVLTAIPETRDRQAAVFYAVALIADARGRTDLAAKYDLKYRDHVVSRTGTPPLSGGPLGP